MQFFVENTGTRYGAEVPQVYLGLPTSIGEPPKRLVAFQKVWLNPGEKRKVQLSIDPSSTNHPLGYWDSVCARLGNRRRAVSGLRRQFGDEHPGQ